MGELEPEVVALLRKYALQNALEYDGQGQVGSVMGRVMGENPDLRSRAQELTGFIASQVAEANALAVEKGLEHIRTILEDESPDALEKKVKERREGLPPLPNAEMGKVVLRFAPNPNGPLSFGHARGVVINAELARMYDGEVILR
ncbi:MAG: glutamate--tRNA ligase family protein, partial [Candidatus Poseidoniales archaeon]|nr:glutamate--tRNA ligase family protein [Candidatus Poseidoniales archaeon]